MVDFHLVMETLNFGVMVIDDQERIVYCNRKEAELRGVETNCIIGQSIYDCHRPEAREEIAGIIAAFKARGNVTQNLLRHRGGLYVEQWIMPLYSAGQYRGLVMTSLDVTARERKARQYEDLVIKDHLTGLFNKNHFQVVLEEMLSQIGCNY
ncbi:MAG: PAS domain-containing protein [Firmicutes bacterium]|nr:PAS domain-containing protein [Bacillota bacterium]